MFVFDQRQTKHPKPLRWLMTLFTSSFIAVRGVRDRMRWSKLRNSCPAMSLRNRNRVHAAIRSEKARPLTERCQP